MITFQIYLSAANVKAALKMRQELIDGGVSEEAISFPSRPAVARSAAPSGFVGDKSDECLALEAEWENEMGKGFRCSPDMAALFSLPDDRAGRIRRMLELVRNGQAVRTASGWQPFATDKRTGKIALPDCDEIDTDEVV